jgi:hypothetical protein
MLKVYTLDTDRRQETVTAQDRHDRRIRAGA